MVKKKWTNKYIKEAAKYIAREVGLISGWTDSQADDIYDAKMKYANGKGLELYDGGIPDAINTKINDEYFKLYDSAMKKLK